MMVVVGTVREPSTLGATTKGALAVDNKTKLTLRRPASSTWRQSRGKTASTETPLGRCWTAMMFGGAIVV